MYCPTQVTAWQQLAQLARASKKQRISDCFSVEPERAQVLRMTAAGILADFSKTKITTEVRSQLLLLTEQSPLQAKRAAMFAGEKINNTEQRAVLHVALRDLKREFADLYGADKADLVAAEQEKIARVSKRIRQQKWSGFSGTAIRHVVNIGIGGSDLGPKMVCETLRHGLDDKVRLHFVSNVDETHLPHTLRHLSPEETLFIVSSKTFTTQETLLNAQAAKRWIVQHFDDEAAVGAHFIAVTANPEAASAFGIQAENMLTFWDWVGGRYSLWSSIGLPIAVALGYETFTNLLAGAHAMDQHFLSADFAENLPVMLALAGIWHINFQHMQSLAVIPYNDALSLLPMYLQQLDMESNGKSVDVQGRNIDYHTGPVLWGQNGSNGQHAFFQLLHQGRVEVPIELIAALNPRADNAKQHRVLLANMLAQSSAFMTGAAAPDGEPYLHYPGDTPSVTLLLEELTAHNLGALLALYEHKIFVQGVIWNINSFDQWGVQLGKRLAGELGTDFANPPDQFDPSTRSLMQWIAARLDR
ncbi:MAG: glucose-6-phosphate isomerase [Pseudomonadales bacterium]